MSEELLTCNCGTIIDGNCKCHDLNICRSCHEMEYCINCNDCIADDYEPYNRCEHNENLCIKCGNLPEWKDEESK
jgi:hypothetical protein